MRVLRIDTQEGRLASMTDQSSICQQPAPLQKGQSFLSEGGVADAIESTARRAFLRNFDLSFPSFFLTLLFGKLGA